MATLIERTIGTGGDYSTIALWYASIPANLVTPDEIHRGLLLNQEHTVAAALNITGKTTSASCYIELTTAAGCSFLDHANKATNPLRYNSSVGACITASGTAITIQSQQAHTRFSKFMIRNTNTTVNAPPALVCNATVGNPQYIDKCIIESNAISTSLKGSLRVANAGSVVSNCVVINHKADAAAVLALFQYNVNVHNCTFLALGGVTLTTGILTQYVAAVFKNIYVGGVTAVEDGTVVATKTNCYSSATATNYTTVPMSTATFENVTSGTHDARLKSTSALINAGVTDATYASTDILGTARPAGGSYDVGAHEYNAVVPPVGTLGWTEGSSQVSVTGNITITSITGSAGWTEGTSPVAVNGNVTIPLPTLTVLGVSLNNGYRRVGESFTAIISQVATGALVVRLTGKVVNGAGNLILQSDQMTPGTEYRLVLEDSNGNGGVGRLTAVNL
jgi:hypothetical protein